MRRTGPAAAALALALAGLPAGPALAQPTPAALPDVGVRAAAGAQAPLAARFMDAEGGAVTLGSELGGRPALLLFEDYRCTTLCGPALAIAAHALATSRLSPGRDVRLVTVGLNPQEGPADARAMRDARLADQPALRADARFLSGDAGAIGRTTAAMGYHFARDAGSGQYVHPVAAFVLTREGRLSRVLDQVSLTGPELRDALGAAGRGGFGSVMDHLALLCHGISVAAGRYNGAVALGLKLGGLATLAAMAGGLLWLAGRRPRSGDLSA